MRSLIVIAIITASHAWSQPAFEVASVKLLPSGSTGLMSISPSGAGSFTATNVTLELMIELAFGVDENQISGKPGWASSQLYDVSGKPEGKGGLSYEQLRPMLQQLLRQRFGLATHREAKDVSGYALVVAKGGPKLKESTTDSGQRYILKDGIRFQYTTLAGFAAALARPTGRPVVDKTGIAGTFDIKLDYAPEGLADSSRPSLYTALQEQLGLKLEAQKVPVEMLVIEHAERVPTEN